MLYTDFGPPATVWQDILEMAKLDVLRMCKSKPWGCYPCGHASCRKRNISLSIVRQTQLYREMFGNFKGVRFQHCSPFQIVLDISPDEIQREHKSDFLIWVIKDGMEDHLEDTRSFAICQYLECHSFLNIDTLRYILCMCARHGNLPICQWLASCGILTESSLKDTFITAAIKGHIPLCEWLDNHFDMSRYSMKVDDFPKDFMFSMPANLFNMQYSLHYALKGGHTHMARWLIERFDLDKTKVLLKNFIDHHDQSEDPQFWEWAKARLL